MVGRSEHGLSLATRDGSLALDLVERARAAATRHQVELSLRGIAEPSLESVFLDVTGRSLRDPAEDSR